MKFCFICSLLCCFNLLVAQEDEDGYEYYDVEYNKYFVSVGADYLITQSDFGRKVGKHSLGGSLSIFRQMNYSQIFLGAHFSSRRLDNYRILDRFPDTNQNTSVRNYTASLAARVYPEIYFSIFEVFFEGGAGLNIIRGVTSLYDVINEESYDRFVESSDYKPLFYGSAGFHIPLNESWFITTQFQTYYGTTIDFIAKKDDLTNIQDTYLAFDFKSATYRASSISVSLSLLF